uniref:Integrase catalytic domain-containing protein n=1 Tax=Phlebotomus papatasi TaxID=29031 RepID=A0A1B0GQC7_PHLPP
MPMSITSSSPYPFYKVFMDIVGPLSITEQENRYILTIYDDLSKYLVAIPLKTQTSEEVAEAFVNRFVCIFGAPIIICTDQGGCFISELFKRVCQLLKISKTQASPFHPQTSGGIERAHRTLGDYLRIFTENNKYDWDVWIPKAVAAFNSSVHGSHNFTPHELVFGEKFDISSFSQPQNEPVYNPEDFITNLRRILRLFIWFVLLVRISADDLEIPFNLTTLSERDNAYVQSKGEMCLSRGHWTIMATLSFRDFDTNHYI